MKTVKTMVYGMTVLRDMLPTVSSTLMIIMTVFFLIIFILNFYYKILRCVDVFWFCAGQERCFRKDGS